MQSGERRRRHRAEIDDDCGRCGGKLGVDDAVERRVRNVAHEIAAAEPAPERAEAFRSVDDGDADGPDVLPDGRRGSPREEADEGGAIDRLADAVGVHLHPVEAGLRDSERDSQNCHAGVARRCADRLTGDDRAARPDE